MPGRKALLLLVGAVVASLAVPVAIAGPGRDGNLDRPRHDRPVRTERLDTRLYELAVAANRGGHGADRVDVEVFPADGASGRLTHLLESVGGSDVVRIGEIVAASVPVPALSGLGRHPDVRWVRSASVPIPQSVTGEGVAFIDADEWHTGGITGAGVKVAVIDVGFLAYGALLGDDLPAAVTLQNYCSNLDGDQHGSAVAEIVHEVAPSAELYLICIDSLGDLGLAVTFAIAQGIDVINTSLGWVDTGRGDGSGALEAAVEDARDNGILWVSSAGNYGATHWGGSFADGDADGYNNFVLADETLHLYLATGQPLDVTLRWDDWGSTGYDYDLLLYDDWLDNPVAWSINNQLIGAPPTEKLLVVNTGPGGYFHVVVAEYAAPPTPVPMDLFFWGGMTSLEYTTSAGSVADPASSPIVLAVGAAHVDTGNIEPYSSRGPTISNVTKPDLTGPARVSGATYGPDGFAGTSASSPHIAGAAALLLEVDPDLTPAGLTAALKSLGVDAGPAGVDNTYGWGLLRMGPPPVVPGTLVRYAGPNRYATASAISQGDFPDPDAVSTVFVATGTNFPDGLAGAAVAAQLGAPLLLVNPGEVPPETATELTRLTPDTIVILGGTGVIPDAVKTTLEGYAAAVTRIAGANRYATAVAVSQYGFPSTAPVVFVATGTGFADALAAGPAAARLGGPVLLTEPGSLPTVVSDEILRLAPTTIVVVGGTGAVSQAVFDALELLQVGDTVTRIAGASRYDTAVALSQYAFDSSARAYIATGLNFPDALAGAAAAGVWDAPVLLVPTSLPEAVSAEITALDADTVIMLGGSGVVNLTVENSLKALLNIS